jgi:hypothetical protein
MINKVSTDSGEDISEIPVDEEGNPVVEVATDMVRQINLHYIHPEIAQ